MICNICTARISDKCVVCPECGAPVRSRRPQQQRYGAPGTSEIQPRQEQNINRANMRPNYDSMNRQTERPQERQPDRYAYSGAQRQPMYRNEQNGMRPPQTPAMSADMRMNRPQQPAMQPRFPQNNGQNRYMAPQYGMQNQSVNIMQTQRPAPSQSGNIDISKPSNIQQSVLTEKTNAPEQQSTVPENEKPYTTAGFIGTFIVGAIPVVGWILYLVWCFSKKVNKSKKAYCRAVVILWFILVFITSITVILTYFFAYDFFNEVIYNLNNLM